VGHQDMAVFVSGAIVMDLVRGKVIHRMGMDSGLARDISRVIEAEGHAALALQDHDVAESDYLATSDVALDEATRQWMLVTSAKVERAGRLAEHKHPCTLRVGLVAGPKETARVERVLLERLGSRIIAHSLFVPAYEVEVLEAFDPAVNKWQGILRIAAARNVSPAEIVAVGDDVNDISMLHGAGLGAAMGNAKPQVKAAARRVLRPNTEDGLAEFLEELITSHDRV
jgi:5-amino-6-(5-phospho-D-ribitylamino)uracil phosphatase